MRLAVLGFFDAPLGAIEVNVAPFHRLNIRSPCAGEQAQLHIVSHGFVGFRSYGFEKFSQFVGLKESITFCFGKFSDSLRKNSLKEDGRLLLVQGGLPDILPVIWVWMTGGKRIIAGPASVRVDDLHLLGQLAEQGKLRPVIDRRYGFDQIVEAYRYVDSGRKKGNVVVTL